MNNEAEISRLSQAQLAEAREAWAVVRKDFNHVLKEVAYLTGSHTRALASKRSVADLDRLLGSDQ